MEAGFLFHATNEQPFLIEGLYFEERQVSGPGVVRFVL